MWQSAPVEQQGAKATHTQARDGLVAKRAVEDQDDEAAVLTRRVRWAKRAATISVREQVVKDEMAWRLR